jgi:hypothetical protein
MTFLSPKRKVGLVESNRSKSENYNKKSKEKSKMKVIEKKRDRTQSLAKKIS